MIPCLSCLSRSQWGQALVSTSARDSMPLHPDRSPPDATSAPQHSQTSLLGGPTTVWYKSLGSFLAPLLLASQACLPVLGMFAVGCLLPAFFGPSISPKRWMVQKHRFGEMVQKTSISPKRSFARCLTTLNFRLPKPLRKHPCSLLPENAFAALRRALRSTSALSCILTPEWRGRANLSLHRDPRPTAGRCRYAAWRCPRRSTSQTSQASPPAPARSCSYSAASSELPWRRACPFPAICAA